MFFGDLKPKLLEPLHLTELCVGEGLDGVADGLGAAGRRRHILGESDEAHGLLGIAVGDGNGTAARLDDLAGLKRGLVGVVAQGRDVLVGRGLDLILAHTLIGRADKMLH